MCSNMRSPASGALSNEVTRNRVRLGVPYGHLPLCLLAVAVYVPGLAGVVGGDPAGGGAMGGDSSCAALLPGGAGGSPPWHGWGAGGTDGGCGGADMGTGPCTWICVTDPSPLLRLQEVSPCPGQRPHPPDPADHPEDPRVAPGSSSSRSPLTEPSNRPTPSNPGGPTPQIPLRDRLTFIWLKRWRTWGPSSRCCSEGAHFEGWRAGPCPQRLRYRGGVPAACAVLVWGPGEDISPELRKATLAAIDVLCERVDDGELRHVTAQLPEALANLFPDRLRA